MVEELIHELFAALNARDLDGALACMTDDVDWAGWPSRVRGRDAVRSYLSQLWSALDVREEPLAFDTAADGSIAVDVHLTVRAPDGELRVDRRDHHTYMLHGGLVARMDEQASGPPPILRFGGDIPRRSAASVRVSTRGVSDESVRPRLYWKWEVEEDDGEAAGPVWIERRDGTSEEWEEWARRSAAEAYAAEHGFEFVADE